MITRNIIKMRVAILLFAFSILMSLPWLLPHCGWLALIALVPLLCAEKIASQEGLKGFFWWYYGAFVLFNALTTWWVCKATVGGGIFATLANALFMAVIFAGFRLSKKRFRGALPYIFLAAMWIAWERFYMVHAEISWPWLTFGNAFARTTHLVQWYEWTGLLGGSLWIWLVNLSIFGIIVALSDGRWFAWNGKARLSAAIGLTLAVALPIVTSEIIYATYEEKSDAGTLDVAMAQSNFDPWHKLRMVPQFEQNEQVINLFSKEFESRRQKDSPLTLMILPETFTSDIWFNDVTASPTWRSFQKMVGSYPNVNLLFGASTHRQFFSAAPPSPLARQLSDGSWYLSYNSAFMTDSTGRADYVDKSKLVVGSELTPFPSVFAPLDDALSKMLGARGGLMGRCVSQGGPRCLEVKDYIKGESIKLGVPICYESIYSDFCRGYVNDGAVLLSVITNDGWWGDTPGYRQHFSYSRLRAIELRRDIARCANTGISAFIDQKGDVIEESKWWTPDLLHRKVNLTSHKTFFAQNGDIVGRLSTFVFALMLLALLVRVFTKK